MGPRIYPSYQDTNTTAKGSLIINFLDIFADQYNDYIQVSVNGLLRDRTYNKVDGLYRTNLNIGDVVLIEIVSDIILFKNITENRMVYAMKYGSQSCLIWFGIKRESSIQGFINLDNMFKRYFDYFGRK